MFISFYAGIKLLMYLPRFSSQFERLYIVVVRCCGLERGRELSRLILLQFYYVG